MIQDKLMVGNWVTDLLSDKPRMVTSVKSQKVKDGIYNSVTLDYDTEHHTHLPDHLHGIPLTPEILEKAGFEKDRNGWHKSDTQLSFSLTKHGTYLPCWDDRAMKEPLIYLHQLQNLYYSLTGTELNIQL